MPSNILVPAKNNAPIQNDQQNAATTIIQSGKHIKRNQQNNEIILEQIDQIDISPEALKLSSQIPKQIFQIDNNIPKDIADKLNDLINNQDFADYDKQAIKTKIEAPFKNKDLGLSIADEKEFDFNTHILIIKNGYRIGVKYGDPEQRSTNLSRLHAINLHFG